MFPFLWTLAVLSQWPEMEWAFKPVEYGATSPLKDKGVFVMRNREELRQYMIKRGSPRIPLPRINWKINQVVAIHVGQAPSAGYTLDVKHLWKRPDGAEAEIVLSRPPEGAVEAQVITYPFAMIRTERFKGKVDFKLVAP